MSILNSVITLSSYPFEKIGIFLDDTVAPEVSSRFGMRIINNTWDYDVPQLTWGEHYFKQRGAEPDLLNSPSLSDLYDIDYSASYKMPYDYINIPDAFPLFFETSAVPGNHLLLTFRGGTSAITVFPSTPYPIINQISNTQFSVSGGFYSISAVDQELGISDLYKNLDESYIVDLASNTGLNIKFGHHSYTGPGSVVYQMYPDGYVSASRKNFVLKTQTNNSNANPLVNQLIPPVSPYSKGIVPESFQMTFTVSGANLEDAIDYTIGYGSTNGAYHYLSGIELQGIDPPLLKLGKLDAANAKLSLSLNTGYFIPKGENYLVSYQASAVPYVKSTTSSFRHGISAFEGTNYYQISAQNSPYFYNYKFNTDTNRDAFTIYFEPQIKTAQTESSSLYVSAIMHDNFYQTEFPIVENKNQFRMKFVEESNDLSLTAVDLNDNHPYIQNQWMPASSVFKFVNDGIANAFTVTTTLSSFKDDIYTLEPYRFILNKEKATSYLSVSAFSENWALIQGNIFPNFDPAENVVWHVEPSQNIKIYDYSDSSDLNYDLTNPNILSPLPSVELTLDSATPANSLGLIVNNLGVDITKITLYSTEFDLSASTLWFPPSSVYNNITLDLDAVVNDLDPIASASISSYFVKNNMRYLAPSKGSIIWKETNNDPRGSTTIYQQSSAIQIFEDVIYPASTNTNIVNAIMDVGESEVNPQKIIFSYNANIFGNKSDDPLSESYNVVDSISIPVRQYPANQGIYISLSASDGTIISSKDYNSKFFLDNTLSATVIAVSSDFSVLPLSSVYWNIPGNTGLNAYSAIFPLENSYCVEVSAFNVRPKNGNFGYYNFTDKLCINILPSSYPVLDYISFPEYNMFPAEKLESDFYNLSYLGSNGLTALKQCLTNIVLSAFGGFDSYHYQIGTKVVTSTNNLEIISVNYSDVSASGIVQISAFNDIFPPENTLTVYNYVSSDNSDVFHQDVLSVDIPALTGILGVDNQNIDLRNPVDQYFDINLDFPFDGIEATGTFQYVLCGTNGRIYSNDIALDKSYSAQEKYTLNPSDLFSIKENTYNTINLQLTGNIVKTIPGGPACTFDQYFATNTITLSVFDGPDLEIYTPHNIYSTNQIISVYNHTTEFPDPFTSFKFNDGLGHITTGLTYSDTISASYSAEGTYSVTLSAIHPTNGTTIKTWDNLFIIKNTFDEYDSEIVRTFPDEIVLPYQLSDVLVKPNEWQWNTQINDKLQKLYTNFETLSALSYSWDINVPKLNIGWLGERNGVIRWNYDTPPVFPYYQSEFIDLKDFTKIQDTWVLINDNRIEFRTDDYNLTLIYSTDHITDGEKFVNPSHVVYIEQTNKLVILEKSNNTILVFDVGDNYSLTLTHYWGGVGERSGRTHLNNPTDLYSNGADIFVVDSDSLNIKIYNTYLNWKNQIDHSEWTTNNYPISVTTDLTAIYVLTSTGKVYIFDHNLVCITTITTTTGTKIYGNQSGFLWIVNNGLVYVYTIGGVFVNQYQTSSKISRLFFNNREIYGLNYFSILKFVDFAQIKDTSDGSNVVNEYQTIAVNPNEPITDFVYNDSTRKLHDNILSFANSLTHKFVININEFDQFVNHEIQPITIDEQVLTTSSYQALGINELVSYETVNRGLTNVWNDLELLRQMVDVRKSRIQSTDVDWTWIYHTINQTQNINDNRRPLSWLELASKSTRFSPSLSAIDWSRAFGGGYERNHMPVHWVWEEMSCNCIWPVTWEQMECGQKFGYSWDYLANHCSFTPVKSFDDCLSSCS